MRIVEALEKVWFAIRPRETCTQFGECSVACPICHASSDMHVRGGKPNPLTHREDCPIPFLDKLLHGEGAQERNYDVTVQFGGLLHCTDVDASDPVQAIEKVLAGWVSSRPLVPVAVSARLDGLDEEGEECGARDASDVPMA